MMEEQVGVRCRKVDLPLVKVKKYLIFVVQLFVYAIIIVSDIVLYFTERLLTPVGDISY